MTRLHSAAMLAIGDEILSGRTQDTNSNYLAKFLGALGIDLKEIRVVGDEEGEIAAALNALRARYDMVFTCGGIGPTHDDITADAVARAFGVDIGHHPQAMALLAARYAPGEFNVMRQRMARIPEGAELVVNPVSVAPGFHIGNVFVLAGVPAVFRAMLETVAPGLPRGVAVTAVTVEARVPEGQIAEALAALQKASPQVAIGSYPAWRDGGPAVQLVARGRDAAAVQSVARAIEQLLAEHGAISRRP